MLEDIRFSSHSLDSASTPIELSRALALPFSINSLAGHYFRPNNISAFKEGSEHFSAVRRIEIERLFKQAASEFSENLPTLKKRLDQLPDFVTWNSFLWESTFAGKLQADDVRDAARVIRPTYEPNSLHSLACAEASTGMVSEAIEDLRRLASFLGEKLKPADSLVVGMIAEQCDLWEAALRAYGKVEDNHAQPSLTSSYDLAQIRIRDIRAKQQAESN